MTRGVPGRTLRPSFLFSKSEGVLSLSRSCRVTFVAGVVLALVIGAAPARAGLAKAPWLATGKMDFVYGAQVQVSGGAATGERT